MASEEQAVEALLQQAGLLARLADEPARRFDRRYAPRFNPVNMVVAETRWSRIIAALLDPDGDHGQGRLFLDAFLQEIEEPKPARFSDPIKVVPERCLDGNGRIDILVTAASAVLGIELKIDSDDQPTQLERYHTALSKLPGAEPVLVYLAKPGMKPRAASLGSLPEHKIKFLPLATEDHKEQSLARSLRAALRDCQAERVRLFVEFTAEALEQICDTRQPVKEPRTMVIEACLRGDPEHLRTALAVRDALSAAKKELLTEFAELLEVTVSRGLTKLGGDWEPLNRSLVSDPSTQYAKLAFRNRRWPERYCLAIERGSAKDGYSYYYGIAFTREEFIDEAEAGRISNYLEAEAGTPKSDRWWPCWSYLPEPLQRWESDEGLVRLAEILRSPTPNETPEVRETISLLERMATAFNAYVTSVHQPFGDPPAID